IAVGGDGGHGGGGGTVGCRRGGGGWGLVRSVRSHASARAVLATSAAFIRASRLDSLNLKFMLGLLLLLREGPSASTTQSVAGGPQDHTCPERSTRTVSALGTP